MQRLPAHADIGHATALRDPQKLSDFLGEAFHVRELFHLASGDGQDRQTVEHELVSTAGIAVDIRAPFVVGRAVVLDGQLFVTPEEVAGANLALPAD